MTLSHEPGTLGAARYAGSQPVAHAASKITTGTIAKARYPFTTGSSFQGTAGLSTAARFPGTTHAKFVGGIVQLVPDVTTRAGAALVQARVGTICQFTSPVASNELSIMLMGPILPTPQAGSYRQVGI